MSDLIRVCGLISGGATTWMAIYDACQAGGVLAGKVTPVLTIASTPKAGGIAKSQARSIPTKIVPPGLKGPRLGEFILEHCRTYDVNFIGQYGWCRWTPPNVIAAFWRRIVNQHPAPLEFGGKDMHGKAPHCAMLEWQRRTSWRDPWTKAICQWVDPEYDRGAVIYELTIPILTDDSVDSLQARVLPVEWLVQIQALELFATGRIHELPPRKPLAHPGEEAMLEECKRIARERYPNG